MQSLGSKLPPLKSLVGRAVFQTPEGRMPCNALQGTAVSEAVILDRAPSHAVIGIVASIVVPAPGVDLTPDGVIAWCRENMANYKVPRFVEIVDSLPTTASGKVTKFVLRERASEQRPPRR